VTGTAVIIQYDVLMLLGEPFGGIIPGVRGAVLAVLLRTGTPLTGRRIHALLSDRFSLSTVQETLRALAQLGLVDSRTVGRAGVHTINEDHCSIAPLRALLDPVAALTQAVREAMDDGVKAVILFGSSARGEATLSSDIDLAVIARSGWDGRTQLEDTVRTRLGNSCDVLVFTSTEFNRLSASGEPVVADILRDGVALLGSVPRANRGAA
jgi:predicted nucleotidyltransferase